MIFRAKLAYMTVGFQAAGAVLFAIFGKPLLMAMAFIFMYIGWKNGEYYSNLHKEEEDNAV